MLVAVQHVYQAPVELPGKSRITCHQLVEEVGSFWTGGGAEDICTRWYRI